MSNITFDQLRKNLTDFEDRKNSCTLEQVKENYYVGSMMPPE